MTFAEFRERLGAHVEWHGGWQAEEGARVEDDKGAPRGAGLRGVAVVQRNVRGHLSVK